MHQRSTEHMLNRIRRGILLGALVMAAVPLGGCWVGTMAGMMAESYKRTSDRPVEAEYRGLEGKTFAVVIAADRVIQADSPSLVPQLTNVISERLRAEAGASGYVPGPIVLQLQYQNPRWEAMTYSELAQEFGVDRLIYIDLYEFRLFERGNSYLWDGQMAGVVGMVEADGSFPDEFAFSREVSVAFPDKKGYGPEDFTDQQVASVLLSRFVDRATWLFYDHREPFYPDY